MSVTLSPTLAAARRSGPGRAHDLLGECHARYYFLPFFFGVGLLGGRGGRFGLGLPAPPSSIAFLKSTGFPLGPMWIFFAIFLSSSVQAVYAQLAKGTGTCLTCIDCE